VAYHKTVVGLEEVLKDVIADLVAHGLDCSGPLQPICVMKKTTRRSCVGGLSWHDVVLSQRCLIAWLATYQRSSPIPTLTPGARNPIPGRGPSSQSR
jgi:hypothetical protein